MNLKCACQKQTAAIGNLFVFILIITGLLNSSKLYAQSALESVAAVYHRAKVGSKEQLLVAGKYAQALFFNNQQAESMHLLDENIERAKSLKDGQYAAYLNSVAALNSRNLDDNKKAMQYLQQAKIFALRTHDLPTKAYVLYCQGWLQLRNKQETGAVKSFQQALDYLDKVPNNDLIIARKTALYKELSSVYSKWNAYELQEKYTNLALQMAKVKNNPMDVFDASMLMGYMYEEQYRNNSEDPKLRNKAESYYLQAIAIYQKNKSKMSIPSDLAFVSINLANLYLQFYPASYKDKSLAYTKLALDIGTQTQQYTQIAAAYGIMAEFSFKDGDHISAKNYLLASLAAMMKENVTDNTIALSLFEKLSKVYEEENNAAEALHYYKQYVKVYEEVYNAEKMEQSRRLEAQFDKERQQQELIRLQLEAEKKEQQLSLMNALSGQQIQQLENMKLNEENQLKQMEVVQLEAEKKGQELRLSRIETKQRAQELKVSQREVAYKSKMNTVYILLIVAFSISVILLYYAHRQRLKTLKQKQILQTLEVNEMKQSHKIATLTAMLQGQETERTRLARDLHDGLGGLLSGTKIGLSGVARKMETDVLKKEVNNTMSQLDVAVDELRRIAHNLMPELLIKYGLEEAIKEYANRMSTDELEISSQFVNYKDNLNSEKQILTYRIIQELVNNAIKHADAKQIFIQLAENDGQIFITVEDDGKGFEPEKLDGKKSAGMHNIQSRLDFLKGDMHIDSRIDIGTTIELEFPLNNINDKV